MNEHPAGRALSSAPHLSDVNASLFRGHLRGPSRRRDRVSPEVVRHLRVIVSEERDRLWAAEQEGVPERFKADAHGNVYEPVTWTSVAVHFGDELGTAQEHARADADRRNVLAFYRSQP